MADGVQLLVNGKSYGGWKSIRITLTIKSLSGSFDLEASDRWGDQGVPWPIREEDACRVELDGEVVIDGYVGKRSHQITGAQRQLTYSGRDKSGALVDNSAVLKSWTFSSIALDAFARKLCGPFDIPVSVQAGLLLPKRTYAVHPGDKIHEALQRASAIDGVLFVSDGKGGIVITRSGTQRIPTTLVEGENILGGSAEWDSDDRFSRYIISSQTNGTDYITGKAITGIHSEASDPGVQRKNRVFYIRPDHGMDAKLAKQRADWEARVRAAKAETVTIIVQGWKQPNGERWPLNKIVTVKAPTSLGVEGDMLIGETQFSVGSGGHETQLHLVRPDAFMPEPKAEVKTSGGAYKELVHGVGK